MAKALRLLIIILTLGVFGLTATTSRGQSGPGLVYLNVPIVLQHTPEWCWLAASEMAIRYRNNGQSIQQCQMMEIGYGLPPGYCCGNPARCVKAANDMGEIRAVILRFGGVITTLAPPTNPMTLYNILNSDRPVIAQIVSGFRSTHAIVIRGMAFRQEWRQDMFGRPVSVMVPYVYINDPMSIFPKIVPYSRLLSVWINSLIVEPFKVTPPPPPPTASGSGSSGTFCTALKRVIRDAPEFRSLRGITTRNDSSHVYEALVTLPGVQHCRIYVRKDDPDDVPEYMCHTPNGQTCSDVVADARLIAHRVKGCLPDWSSNEKTSSQTPYALHLHSKDGHMMVSVHVSRKYDSSCGYGLLSVSSMD